MKNPEGALENSHFTSLASTKSRGVSAEKATMGEGSRRSSLGFIKQGFGDNQVD